MGFNRKTIGFFTGIILFIFVYFFTEPDPSNPLVGKALAVALLMAAWWVSEAIPLAITALIPIVLFPLSGILGAKDVSSAYINHIIFVYLGGFIMALAMEKWNLHRRIALRIMMLIGVGPAFHVALSLAGVALLLGCGVYGGGHVILDRQIRNRSFDTWFQKLPSLGDLDRLRRVNLTTGTALVTLSLLSASVWARFQPSDQPTVVSHQHPMLLLVVILAVLVAADRFRWLSSRHLAVVCLVMSAIVLTLLTVSVIEIFAGRYA